MAEEERGREVVFQCQYCRLPKHPEGSLISHGICFHCLKIHHPQLVTEETMACWKCPDCGQVNCDIDECTNPACPSHSKEKRYVHKPRC